ncbi:MAG: family 10 glycosylhydrolase, partial [Thermoguttaceae bacterium]|nr:family 10 glycosylhydrolase [Thermoguttaceae bacterium]
QYAGVDSLMLSVFADGSALYPSSLLSPSPKYDSGVFLLNGEDPTRKDVLEMIIRQFDREQMSLIPLVDFNAPLPGLEALYQQISQEHGQNMSRYEGIRWIGPDGHLLIDNGQGARRMAPYYNLLHPVVQQEMLNVIQELVDRYGSHRAFDGLAIELSPSGYAQLPDDIFYGMDDETITRFVKETNLQEKLHRKSEAQVQNLLLASGVERYRYRAQFINDYCRAEWVQWRTESVAEFYRKVSEILSNKRPDTRLYLVGTKMLNGNLSLSRLYPSLLQQSNLKECMRIVGFDPGLLAKNPAISFLRPGIIAPVLPLCQTAQTLEWNSPGTISLFSQNKKTGGAVFCHQTEEKNLATFDALSPFQPTLTQINTRAILNGYENRQRFAHQLACTDTMFFADGGDMIPMGQEDSLRDWISVFRNIPAVPFKTWSESGDESGDPDTPSIQPLVVRYYQTERETWVYLLNDAPFYTNVKLGMKYANRTRFEMFTGGHGITEPMLGINSFTWSVSMRPYDLIAFRLTDANATFESVDVSRPNEICGNNGRLAQAVQNFVDRVLIARLGVGMPIFNGDFETEPDAVPNRTDENPEKNKNLLGLDISRMNLLKNPFASESENKNPGTMSVDSVVSSNEIPGWRRFGNERVQVQVDSRNYYQGGQSLRISSDGTVGGVISQPLEPLTTGRLCAQICFGVPENQAELPLRICLTGRYQGMPYQRLLVVGPTVWERAHQLCQEGKIKPENGILWIQDVVLFDHLPLNDLENVSLRFDMLASGTVWIDQIRLYKLAFADMEQN